MATVRLRIVNGQSLKGDTPFIGNNGNWWIGETDTGVPATQDLTDLNNSVDDLNNSVDDLNNSVDDLNERADSLGVEVCALTPIISETDITAGSAASSGRPYHVIE